MRNKRYIVSFLLFISMIMLVVPVIPHHHHADGVICMKNDLTPEPQCPKLIIIRATIRAAMTDV